MVVCFPVPIRLFQVRVGSELQPLFLGNSLLFWSFSDSWKSVFFLFSYFCHNLLKTQRMGGFTGTAAVCPTVGKFWVWFPVRWCSRLINSLASECLDGIPPSPPASSHTSTVFIREDKWCSGQVCALFPSKDASSSSGILNTQPGLAPVARTRRGSSALQAHAILMNAKTYYSIYS